MQAALQLDGGHDHGPLFQIVKIRAPKLRGVAGSRRIWGMVRRNSERRATPAWADRSITRALFQLARIYTEATGERHSVDHEVPLVSPLVCGLHWHGNMRVILLEDNVRKGNGAWLDGPYQQETLL